MTTVAVLANRYPNSQRVKKIFESKLDHYQIKRIDNDIDRPDFVISIGGDGSLLSAFHKYKQFIDHTHFIGIHTGHLGFYTDWLVDEIDELVQKLSEGITETHAYPLLDIEMNYIDQFQIKHICLNEFVIRTSFRTVVCDVFMNGQMFETFRGDGLCISTPTGSTGLNKSLGGAVVHPSIPAFQLTEIGSINNVVYQSLQSSMIIPKTDTIHLKLREPNERVVVTMDNILLDKTGLHSIKLGLSDQTIKFAGFKHRPFWSRVNQTFIGKPHHEDWEYIQNRAFEHGI